MIRASCKKDGKERRFSYIILTKMSNMAAQRTCRIGVDASVYLIGSISSWTLEDSSCCAGTSSRRHGLTNHHTGTMGVIRKQEGREE